MNNCILTGNAADFGGGASGGTLNNFTLIGNAAKSSGGGARVGTLNNCTVVNNAAITEAGGTAQSFLNNCIVYFNAAGSAPNYLIGEFDTTMDYTCTTPLPAGTGNITNDPMFVDMVNSNYHLAAGSPCRDTGNNAFAPGATDLAGNSRIVNGYVDMGAYEYQGAGQGDYDGDGMGNGDEILAGFSPFSNTSVWEIASLTVTDPASITFASVTGRVYAVDRNDALVPNPQVWTEFTNNIPGTGGAIQIMDSSEATNRNYRVRVSMP